MALANEAFQGLRVAHAAGRVPVEFGQPEVVGGGAQGAAVGQGDPIDLLAALRVNAGDGGRLAVGAGEGVADGQGADGAEAILGQDGRVEGLGAA